MSVLVGGKVFIAPNGFDTVRVFRHGYVHPMQVNNFDLISEMAQTAFSLPEADNNPFKAFELMGWDEITDPKILEMLSDNEVKP